jgi:hypothetical protein
MQFSPTKCNLVQQNAFSIRQNAILSGNMIFLVILKYIVQQKISFLVRLNLI